MNNYISQKTVDPNNFSIQQIPASVTKALICQGDFQLCDNAF